MIKVSVIICTLNHKHILPSTIPSIKQSKLVDEILIVEGFKPVGYARNIAWRFAKNEFILFVDDDEVVPEGYIERLAEEFKDPKVGAVVHTAITPLTDERLKRLCPGLEAAKDRDISIRFVVHKQV